MITNIETCPQAAAARAKTGAARFYGQTEGRMKMESKVLFLNDQQVRSLLTQRDVLDIVEETFTALGNGMLRHPRKDPMFVDEEGRYNCLLAMPAQLKHKQVAGMKWISMFSHQKPGLPSSFGNFVILNHTDTGAPFALVEATSITLMRTGGGHAVIGAKHLAKKGACKLAVIGCGDEGRRAIGGFLEEFALKELHLCDLSEAAMDRCIAEHSGRIEKIVKCASPREAVKGTDMVLTVTTSRKPLITADMLEPGMTVLGLNAFNDLDGSRAVGRFRWILGNKHSDGSQIVDNPRFASAHLSMDNVSGDLGEILTGKIPGRTSEDEVIVFTHMGMGSLDLACALVAYERAMEKGIGQTLIFNG